MSGYQCFSIELSRGYNYDSFHEDLQKLYFWAGVDDRPTVFLFSQSQILIEEFVEDLNNILNSGEVPGLFDAETLEKLIIGTRPAAKNAGIAEGDREAIYRFCIDRVRNNLHLVISMSPMGSAFRRRLRMFPSLVNCCTIDWFTEWPEEALLGVAKSSFASLDVDSTELKVCFYMELSLSDGLQSDFVGQNGGNMHLHTLDGFLGSGSVFRRIKALLLYHTDQLSRASIHLSSHA